MTQATDSLLTQAEFALTRILLRRWSPPLLDHLTSRRLDGLTNEVKSAIQEAIGDQLLDSGVGPDGEVNAEGQALDDLIDRCSPRG